MKKIIPFSKDISFNTNLYEINSISLEHNLKLNKDNHIEGEFIISGDYKESDSVIINEPFIYSIPFDIDLDYKYNADNLKIEIDDFNYEIENNILKITINVSIDGVEMNDEHIEEEILEEIEEEKVDKNDVEELRGEVPEEVKSIFNNFNDKDETFVNYHVHIYRENDSIDNILKNYKITKEELEEYNDISTITIGSKIIIPSVE